jgi:TPR repeat protein
VVFASIVVGFSAIAQQSPPPGTHEVSMRWSEINQILHDIEPHAREYPARFDSAQQRSAMQTELMRLLVFLDAAVKEQPDDSDYWFRDAIANGFGHNMGCRDCGEKAIAAFERVERLQPESADVNWRYGAFLAQTAQHEKSIPYLQKAASLGVVDAHYTAAIVFISLNDLPHAMLELKEYLKAVPKDEQAKKLLADMAHGNLHIQVQDGPPPAIPERDK